MFRARREKTPGCAFFMENRVLEVTCEIPCIEGVGCLCVEMEVAGLRIIDLPPLAIHDIVIIQKVMKTMDSRRLLLFRIDWGDVLRAVSGQIRPESSRAWILVLEC